MKKIIKNLMLMALLASIVACDDNLVDPDYDAPLTIDIEGVDNSNIVQVEKGVMSYTAAIKVQAGDGQLALFEIYNADAETGARGSLIEDCSKNFVDEEGNGANSWQFDYVVSDLVENKCIKIVVTDIEGAVFERNLLVKITPVVLFSGSMIMETVENYYGPYFAGWTDGRVYMRRDGQLYKNEIDFSLGDVVIESEGDEAVPALVNPAGRGTYNLLTIDGLQQTKFALTDLTKAAYDDITRVDGSSISALPDPDQDAVKLVKDKVYLFKTAGGKKGLICASVLSGKRGTIENTSGEWIENTLYYQVTLTVKSLAKE